MWVVIIDTQYEVRKRFEGRGQQDSFNSIPHSEQFTDSGKMNRKRKIGSYSIEQ